VSFSILDKEKDMMIKITISMLKKRSKI
jgi:hypothetical protein